MNTNTNPLSANFTKWSSTLKQFLGKLPTNCLSVFEHFMGLALKRLTVTDLSMYDQKSSTSLHNIFAMLMSGHGAEYQREAMKKIYVTIYFENTFKSK